MIRKLLFTIFSILAFAPSSNAGELFSWDVETKWPSGVPTNGLAMITSNSPFQDVNRYGGVNPVEYSTDHAYSGSFSIKIGYPGDEAGVELKVFPFTGTRNLFLRYYEYYSSHWDTNYPHGLKIGRWFLQDNYQIGTNNPYISTKWWNSGCLDDYWPSTNFAIRNCDVKDSLDFTFGNDQNFVRSGHWYKIEIWLVIPASPHLIDCVSEPTCADGACAGHMKIWIDDIQVKNEENLCWYRTCDGTTNTSNTTWESGWFGGNYSGSACGSPSETVYRYIDDLYVSSTLDRNGTGGFWDWGPALSWSTWHMGPDAAIRGNKLAFKGSGGDAWAVSPVVDTGRAVNYITLGMGMVRGSAVLKIRGHADSFTWDEGEPPNWEVFAGPYNKAWRYLQLKVEVP